MPVERVARRDELRATRLVLWKRNRGGVVSPVRGMDNELL